MDANEVKALAMQLIEQDYKAELEHCAQMVLNCGMSTGHAETFTELVGELLKQATEYRGRCIELEKRIRVLIESGG